VSPASALYGPVGIAGGIVAGLVARKAFTVAWERISDVEAPEPDQREVSIPKLAAALALQGAIFQLSRGFVERAARAGFMRATGTWPGEEQRDAR